MTDNPWPIESFTRPGDPTRSMVLPQTRSENGRDQILPVHLGLREQIGINDLQRPDFGDAVPVHDDELTVFWACGVTPQAAIMAARPEFVITHSPGCMFVTDVLNEALATVLRNPC